MQPSSSEHLAPQVLPSVVTEPILDSRVVDNHLSNGLHILIETGTHGKGEECVCEWLGVGALVLNEHTIACPFKHRVCAEYLPAGADTRFQHFGAFDDLSGLFAYVCHTPESMLKKFVALEPVLLEGAWYVACFQPRPGDPYRLLLNRSESPWFQSGRTLKQAYLLVSRPH